MCFDITGHTKVIEKIKEFDVKTIADGPVVAERYRCIEPRILWVLRETDGGGDWDLRDFLADNTKLFSYYRWHATFGALAKVSLGIIKGLSVENVQQLGARSAVDALRDIAVININKRGGGSHVNWEQFSVNAKDFSQFIESQIEILNPEIIIAAGTIDYLPENFRDFSRTMHNNFDSVQLNEKQWLVKAYHTAQTTITHHEYYR